MRRASAAIGRVARRELALHGIMRFAQLSERSEPEPLDIHGVGPMDVRILGEEPRSRGVDSRLMQLVPRRFRAPGTLALRPFVRWLDPPNASHAVTRRAATVGPPVTLAL